jgi:O-antigen/teichoic acid export membrane protein
VVALLAQPFIALFYGDRYLPSAGLFLALLPIVLFDLITSSLFLVALPMNRPKVLAVSDWLRVASLGVTCWLIIPGLAGYGAAIARSISRVVGAAYTFVALRGAATAPEEDVEPLAAAPSR